MSRRKSKNIFYIILALLILPLLFRLLSAKTSLAAWFDDSYSYRNAITISSHTASENSVYITVTIDTSAAGQFQSDCGDLRFTTYGGDILPYYIVSGCTTASTVIHVFFDTFPAGAQTIYYYYGNPSATNGFSSADFTTQATSYVIGSIATQEKSEAPIAYWKFDDGFGTAAKNSTSVTGLNGTTYPASITWQSEDQCISGKCIFVNDVGSGYQSVSIPDNAVLGSMPALSIGLWVKATSNKTIQQIIYKRQEGGSPAWWSYKIELNNLKPTFFVVNAAGTSVSSQADTAIEQNKWYYITGVYDGSQVQIYVNTKAGDSTPASLTGNVYDSANGFYIGGLDTPATYFFRGFVDDVKIYPYARTVAQIKSDYRARGSSKGTSVSLGQNAKNSDALSNGLVGYWKMDESATPSLDSSGNGNSGTWNGTTTATSGKYGNSAVFDGNSDFIDYSAPNSLNNPNELTISGWIKRANNTQIHTVWSQGGSNRLYFDTNAVGLGAWIYTTVSSYNPWANVGYDTNWHYITLSFSSSANEVKLYFDGQLKQTLATQGTLLYTTGLTKIGANDPSEFFAGSIDEVRIYNRALSSAEVQKLYTFAPGPIAYYDFEEGSGITANDKSGNGYSGSVSSAPSWSSGQYGKGLTFTGGSVQQVTVSGMTGKLDKTLTVESWVNYNGITTGGFDRVVARGWVGNGWLLGVWDSGGVDKTYCSIAQGGVQYGVTATDITPGKYHLALTYDGTTLKCYVNGVYTGQNTTMPNATFDTSSDIVIARTTTDNINIDEVRIYNYARSPGQIVEDMNAGHSIGNSPVAHYKFDEGQGTTLYDSSATKNNGSMGTSPRTPSWSSSGKFNKALNFDATTPANGDVVNITDNSAYQATTGLTISAWVKPGASTGGNEWIVARGYGSAPWDDYNLTRLSNGSFAFRVRLASGLIAASTPTSFLSVNTWYHLVGTYDATTGKAYLYVDGVNKGSGTGTGNIQVSSTRLKIGCWGTAADNCDATTPFNGQIDEVKIYNVALTADEVKQDFNGNKAMSLGSISDTSQLAGGSVASNSASAVYCVPGSSDPCSPPVGEWNFEEKTGQTVSDTSGNGKNGTLGVNSSPSTDDPAWTTGKIGSALSFDGSNDYVSVSTNTDFEITDEKTIEFWVKPELQLINWARPISFGGWAGKGWNLITGTVGTDTLSPYFGSDSGWSGAFAPNIPVVRNTWNHVAVVVKLGSYGKSYLNGNSTGASITPPTYYPGVINPLIIGAESGGYYKGQIDGVRIYNYARTPSQIAWDYNQGKPIAHWKLNECQGTVANDSSGNNNVGTITIGATGTNTSAGTCTTSGAWFDGATGKYGASLDFDATDDVIVANVSNLPSKTVSVSAWIKANSYFNWNNFVSHNWVGNGWIIFATNTNQIYFGVAQSGSQYNIPTDPLSTGVWYHITGVYDGSYVKIYLNGKYIRQAALSNATLDTTASSVRIGGGSDSQIDDVRIYNYALTPSQIKNVYNEDSAIRFGP